MAQYCLPFPSDTDVLPAAGAVTLGLITSKLLGSLVGGSSKIIDFINVCDLRSRGVNSGRLRGGQNAGGVEGQKRKESSTHDEESEGSVVKKGQG